MQPTDDQFYIQKLEFVEKKYPNSSSTTQGLINKYFGHEYDYIERVGATEYFIAVVDGSLKVIGRKIEPNIGR